MTTGPRILITGAASGLGAALAQEYAGRGARLLLTDLREIPDDLRLTAEGSLRHDITSDEDWELIRSWVEEHWGGLDLLVNNAGVAGGGRIEWCDIEEWRWITEINLLGIVRGVRSFTPMLKVQRQGHILNVASLAGLVHPAGMGSYNAVKAAVVAFTETIGHELGPFGVTASVACPSYFRTNLMSSMRGADATLGSVIAGLVERSPYTAGEIAREIVEGVDRGDRVIVPDDAARAAVALKRDDPDGYHQVMVAQAKKLADSER
jgi:NAD(P)-dependent dehydrogenase (short-subunit alcohol dehydrogenase family)